jgi:hypothetical protein
MRILLLIILSSFLTWPAIGQTNNWDKTSISWGTPACGLQVGIIAPTLVDYKADQWEYLVSFWNVGPLPINLNPERYWYKRLKPLDSALQSAEVHQGGARLSVGKFQPQHQGEIRLYPGEMVHFWQDMRYYSKKPEKGFYAFSVAYNLNLSELSEIDNMNSTDIMIPSDFSELGETNSTEIYISSGSVPIEIQ